VSDHSLWIDLVLTENYYLRKPTLGFALFLVQQAFGAVALLEILRRLQT
jgi:hypothetical protein